ncbi:MAG TPA: toxin-antitoxin system HicB family antitoxin [Syntrophomonadaceae bacterium]|nr:toxin-antitoxin system HicB family antitoxin [Syntrophomonadaceae bacterium]
MRKKQSQLNVRINKDLHRKLNIYCAEKGVSKKQVIEGFLRGLLTETEKGKSPQK